MEPSASQGGHGTAIAFEAAEIEARLRKHTLELTEPTIARTAHFERRLREAVLSGETTAENLRQLQQKVSGQDNVKLTIESFRGELAEWDEERRDHQHLMNEKLCIQDDEVSSLHRKIELQSFRTEACNRGLKRLGDLLAETKSELTELRHYCGERIDVNREKIGKLKDDLEARHVAIETTQFKLADDITNMTTVFQHVNQEISKISFETAQAVQGVEELWQVKATVATVEEQHETFAAFRQNLTDAFGDLKQQLDGVITEVQEHFGTASNVLAASTYTQIEEMRGEYAKDLEHMQRIGRENVQLNQRVDRQEQELARGLKEAQSRWSLEMSVLKESLDERQQGHSRGDYLLEVQQLRRSCRELEEKMGRQERARGLERDAMQAIVESQHMVSQILFHDDLDRSTIALFGCRPEQREGQLPSIGTPRNKKEEKLSMPLVSLDKRCLSCCGGAGSVLAGFKIACLNYTAGPVEYRQRMYSRPDLLSMQSKLVDQAYDRMQRAAM